MMYMKFFVVLLAVSLGKSFDSDLTQHWLNYKKAYNKIYDKKEDGVRRAIFEQKVALILHHNLEADLGIHTYRLGLNKLSDMTREEIVKQLNGFRMFNQTKTTNDHFVAPPNVIVSDAIDWRIKGVVTDVKNQEQCGSCWAFSATGSVEGQHALKTGNAGCNGGSMDGAFRYIIKNRGIDTEMCYPYTGKDGQCKFRRDCVGASIITYKTVTMGSENALKLAVATIGPISVTIDASRDSFHSYSGGIYNDPFCSSTQLDHGVLAVGYGNDNGIDYWLVKNSWSKQWGEEGYIRMSRNKYNQCGIATMASYPIS